MTSRTSLLLCGMGLFLVIALALVVLKAPPDGLERGQLSQFLGRFHPLVVHLPIALVLLVAALECAGFFRNGKQLQASASFVLTLAAVTALIAVFLGWLLANAILIGLYAVPQMPLWQLVVVFVASTVWVVWLAWLGAWPLLPLSGAA